MLFVVLFFIMISSIAIFFLRRNIKTVLMLCLCISFCLMFIGIMIFQAKNGGINTEQKFFLFFDISTQRKLSYLAFPLMKLGYMIAIGRALFPGFFLMLSLEYSMLSPIMRAKFRHITVMLLPVLSLILYHPSIFTILEDKHLELILINLTSLQIQVYLIISLLLLIIEYRGITIPYCKKQFRYIMLFLICMGTMYWLYSRQDPIQVYRMYAVDYMRYGGVLYSDIFGGDIRYWVLVASLTTVFGIFGFYNLGSYSGMEYEETRGDILIQKKMDMASKSLSVFVHGMKNQLLASKILISKLQKELENENVDKEALKKNTELLENMNKSIISRMDTVYRSIRTEQLTLMPVLCSEVVEKSSEMFKAKYPDSKLNIKLCQNTYILADTAHLCEAIYNILTNAYENMLEAGKEDEALSINLKKERLYITFELKDSGTGMSKKTQKKIFEPFYTSKNTNNNWGLGLYYVKQIVKNHFGILRLESKEGVGTSFFISIPKYGR